MLPVMWFVQLLSRCQISLFSSIAMWHVNKIFLDSPFLVWNLHDHELDFYSILQFDYAACIYCSVSSTNTSMYYDLISYIRHTIYLNSNLIFFSLVLLLLHILSTFSLKISLIYQGRLSCETLAKSTFEWATSIL